jgi:hypothetical protein
MTPASYDEAKLSWGDLELEIKPLIGYVPGFTIFPPLTIPLGQITVEQDGQTTVLDFDRAVLDDSLPERHAEHRDRTLTMGRALYADFVANFGEVTG